MKIKRLEHIAIAVNSLGQSIDLLKNTFGLAGEYAGRAQAEGVRLRDETPRIGHGGVRIASIDPVSTGNVLIELAELPAGHGGHA